MYALSSLNINFFFVLLVKHMVWGGKTTWRSFKDPHYMTLNMTKIC
jgi:hypothetical protein